MKEFYINKKLPSIKIDKQLIERLENYIINDVSEIIGIEKEIIKKEYVLQITDSFGIEEYESISEFPMSIFQDGTEQITLEYSIYGNPVLAILNVSFSKKDYFTTIKIRLKTNNPREKAQGIFNGILDRINPYKTYNSFFHNQILGGIIWGLSLLTIYFVFGLFMDKEYLWGVYLTVVIILTNYLINNGKSFKPYSEFITSKQLRINKIFSFFIWGTISYLVFGLGYELIVKSFF